MRSHLLNDTTTERYRASVTEGVERVAATVAAASRPFTGVQADELSPRVAAVDLDAPLHDTVAALDELEELYLRDAVHFHHPRHLAGGDGPVVIPAVLGEAVLSAVNSSLDTWDRSTGGTLIERRLIDWAAERAGLGPAADGVFTSGGDQADLQALLLAREEAGTDDPRRLRVLTSAGARPGIRKAAKLLGLGPDAVIAVRTDRAGRMQTVALVRELERCAREGLVPMAVVASAGTADFGSIDPLPQIAEVCARHGVRLHVDAAHGCGPLVSRTRRHLLDGIERADSVTVDFHASLFQPAGCAALLVRDAATLRHATDLTDHPEPRRAAQERVPGQAGKSLQGTRRFDALKLWLTLRVMGADAVGDLFDEVCSTAARGFDLIAADPRFDVVAEPQLATLVFRYIPAAICSPADIDRANLYARKALFASGDAVVAGARAGERRYLKLALRNPETTAADLAAVLDLIAGHAEQYLGESLDRAS
ncbi:pyridoxal phosphate-dependent decarboxylase family protein [Streptomyces spectabilis]|uniref:L-2,4-diaminobutyrate decarboxylase n=1 Tax=Streptomyces spectabilis TaxID=68270 RepID=A0A5P2XA27_STRST|nr:pyridoxal-dependent decarboxylase [Streptomyces spectabilis]MBB5106245.1 L-2,4-diaminobutyrate decarboxylase [Streptomyces spectabilis]MCI3902858.1 pyridoxal-dependent decarboxylase [Streptomyces spectabilis]QEV60139.1 pyridoxal-dependent decarboxylase [Streptomyces spectabilis]GGV33856.1 pyridoxal-dependent decarboxylase [Streptomyces spectabilis]